MSCTLSSTWWAGQPLPKMIVSAPADPEPGVAGPIRYFTPTGDKPSPVFSRVARVSGPELVFTRGWLTPAATGEAEAAIRATFRNWDYPIRRQILA